LKTNFETEDLEEIKQAVLDALKPLLYGNSKQETGDTIFDVPGLSEYLHVTPKWIHERTHLKEMPFYKLSNKQLRFRKRDIDKWLDSLRTPAVNKYTGRLKVVNG
jgi:hypothetical protein